MIDCTTMYSLYLWGKKTAVDPEHTLLNMLLKF